jgi:hypothetical protein
VLKVRSDQTDGVSVDLHQQRLNGCASAILAACDPQIFDQADAEASEYS